MATTLTWIGGGSNKASNPKDWADPNGLPAVPLPGDTLFLAAPTGSSGPVTINISGNDLAGDTFSSGFGVVHSTINLSHDAVTNLLFEGAVVNIQTVNIATNSTWTGSFTAIKKAGPLTITGGSHSAFANTNIVPNNDGVVIRVPVIGTGTFTVGGGDVAKLEFLSSVAQGQQVDVEQFGRIIIDQPTQFLGGTTLHGPHFTGEIDLMGLATADSYTYDKDMTTLSIYSGNTVIDTLRLTDQTTYGIAVTPPTAAGTVAILAQDSVGSLPSLPIHGST